MVAGLTDNISAKFTVDWHVFSLINGFKTSFSINFGLPIRSLLKNEKQTKNYFLTNFWISFKFKMNQVKSDFKI